MPPRTGSVTARKRKDAKKKRCENEGADAEKEQPSAPGGQENLAPLDQS
jgi:hypothetical protein